MTSQIPNANEPSKEANTQPMSSFGNTPGAKAVEADAAVAAVTDQVDEAIVEGTNKAHEVTAGNVVVGETGDLHDLAARRASKGGVA